jgi:hypothetical protein
MTKSTILSFQRHIPEFTAVAYAGMRIPALQAGRYHQKTIISTSRHPLFNGS